MKKQKEFTLTTVTDVKIFILFLLDHVGYPLDYTTLSDIMAENVGNLSLEYDQSIRELADGGYVYSDEVDGERYYMISETGRLIATDLYDELDQEFREKSIRCAARHISLSKSGAKVGATIKKTENNRYAVNLRAADATGEIMDVTLIFSSLKDAQVIRENYLNKPDAVYRGVLFSATGKLEYLS